MSRLTTIGTGVLAAVAYVGAAPAHHSGSMYVTAPTWVTGKVVRFEDVNPHTIISLEEPGPDGQVRIWAIEGPGQSQLDRMGLRASIPKVGDVAGFCAFGYKSPEELSTLFPDTDFARYRIAGSSPKYAAGHVMELANGERRLWNPHGVISECVRSSGDQRQSWVEFLDSDRKAREAWCQQKQYAVVQSTAALRNLVEEIGSSVECD